MWDKYSKDNGNTGQIRSLTILTKRDQSNMWDWDTLKMNLRLVDRRCINQFVHFLIQI